MADTTAEIKSLVESASTAIVQEIDFLVPGVLTLTAILMTNPLASDLMARMYAFNTLVATIVSIAIVVVTSAVVFPVNRLFTELILKRMGIRWLLFRLLYPYMFPLKTNSPPPAAETIATPEATLVANPTTHYDYGQVALNKHLGVSLYKSVIYMPPSERKVELIRRKRIGRLLRGLWVPLSILAWNRDPLLLSMGNLYLVVTVASATILISEAFNDALAHSIAMKALES